MSRWSVVLLSAAALAGCAAPPPGSAPLPAPPAAAVPPALGPVRPIPGPVVPPREFLAAVERGTRTLQGRPGPRYWTNRADYDLRMRVDPAAKRVTGSGQILYHNRSPHALSQLHVDLLQNLHAPGVLRNEAAEVTGGVTLGAVTLDGRPVGEGPGDGARYVVEGTRMVIVPTAPVAPGATVRLGMDWSFAVPKAGGGARMGWDADNLMYLAYWYPAMAVFDDVVGWHPDPFTGNAEFYSDFGRFAVTVEAPAGWVVEGTGELQNPEETLAPAVLARLRVAAGSDTVVRVVGPDDFGRTTTAGRGGMVTWRFVADSVRDATYSLTRESIWDVARTPVGDRDGDGQVDYTRVGAFWRPLAPRWRHVARYEQHAITFLSEYTGVPYPWPHMTAVEGQGIIGGGMEHPMMTIIGPYTQQGDSALYNVTAHELAHMWVPMIVSTDERRYSWMDEGITTFAENQARKSFFPGSDPEAGDRGAYLQRAVAGAEGPIMRRSDYHYTSDAFVTASYFKPGTLFATLRELLGEETFRRAYVAFHDEWKYRHPMPWDMFNVFEREAGRDLDWFWQSWYFETWTLDHAIASVTPESRGTTITIRDEGEAIMPARLLVTREGGATEVLEVPAETWLSGTRTALVVAPAGAPVVRVVLNPSAAFPETDRSENVWVRP